MSHKFDFNIKEFSPLIYSLFSSHRKNSVEENKRFTKSIFSNYVIPEFNIKHFTRVLFHTFLLLLPAKPITILSHLQCLATPKTNIDSFFALLSACFFSYLLLRIRLLFKLSKISLKILRAFTDFFLQYSMYMCDVSAFYFAIALCN